MDDYFTGGFLIASEDDLDAFFNGHPDEQLNLPLIPGRNIKTGCYGLFLVALDQCEDTTEKATLEEALTALESVYGCMVASALGPYYHMVDIDYSGTLKLADVILFLSDEAGGRHSSDLAPESITSIDSQLTQLLGISQEDAMQALFDALGFTPEEIVNDGPKQTELNFE